MKEELQKRAIELLKATKQILDKANEGPYVENVFELTAFYDGTDCDGYCLLDDINDLFEKYKKYEKEDE